MKINKKEFNIIKKRIEKGESFTSIGKEYGVSAWTIQKRYGMKKPKRKVKIWEYVKAEKILSVCEVISRKLYNYDKDKVYDFCMDYSLSLTDKEIKKVKKWKGASGLYYILLNRAIMHNKNKKDIRLYISETTGHILNN